jgi:hypothetical protein
MYIILHLGAKHIHTIITTTSHILIAVVRGVVVRLQ